MIANNEDPVGVETVALVDTGASTGQDKPLVPASSEPPQIVLERGAIAAGEDPLVRAVEISAYQGRDEGQDQRILKAAITRHYAQDLHATRMENIRVRGQVEACQEEISELRAENAGLTARIDAYEKPWIERARNLVGGGLIGMSFTVFKMDPSSGIFLAILGIALVAVPLIVEHRKSRTADK